MTLVTDTTKAPIPFEPELGQAAADLLAGVPQNISHLLTGVAGCSPYLRNLVMTEADWLRSVLDQHPKAVLAAIKDGALSESSHLARDLRAAKRKLALYVALADIGGMWGLNEVTAALADFADYSVQAALSNQLKAEFDRGRLPGCTKEDLKTSFGMVILAMGKMGADELNYSSDIDLIVLFDESRHDPAHFDTIRERFIRITKRMSRMLSDVTADGYVFRTDLRLRPDPSVTPVCLSMAAAERYYESVGRTWERAAYIKARPCAGDMKAGWAFLESLRPFVWRKHLDYAAIQDAHDMRLRIREHKGLGGPITLAGHNMKLGRGGIREIEFFTQTRQIIAGGRDKGLRSRRTVDGLNALAAKEWIPTQTADDLASTYEFHRKIEHRIQMLSDAQTHDLPSSPEQMRRLAYFCGDIDSEHFQADVKSKLELVHELTERFFQPDGAVSAAPAALSQASRETVEKWRTLPALRSNRAGAIFDRLEPKILAKINETHAPDETLRQFDGFLAGLPAGVQLFSLFEANPHLIELLVDICGSAPVLAQYLSRNAQVFDGVIGGTFFQPLPGADELTAALDFQLAGIADYEDQLNAARRWMKEQHFRIGVQHLKSMISSDEAAQNYSDLARAVLAALFGPVCADFARRHGPMPGRGAAVLGMGSLGAGRLTSTSDLDLIVIYDALGQEASSGKRPLAVSTYFARLTQSLVTALASPMAEGRLYEVDMRLRPSGRKGPVATPLAGFQSYQQSEAWTWEHLALTRACVITGNPLLASEIEIFRAQVIANPRDMAAVLKDVADMRARLATSGDTGRTENPFETKLGQGRTLDIELVAQTGALLAGAADARSVEQGINAGVTIGWVDKFEAETLLSAYNLLKPVQQISRLLVADQFDPAHLGEGGCQMLLSETGTENIEALRAKLADNASRVSKLIDSLLSRNLS